MKAKTKVLMRPTPLYKTRTFWGGVIWLALGFYFDDKLLATAGVSHMFFRKITFKPASWK